MDAVAAVVGIIGLANEALRVYERLDRCFRNLRDARGDVQRVRNEMETFAGLLSYLHSMMSQSEAMDSALAKSIKEQIIPRIVSDGKHAIRKVEHL